MLEKIASLVGKKRFQFALKSIDNTAPIYTDSAPLTFVTLLQHTDVRAYLLSIKSIYPSFGEGRVHIVNDGSLTEDDLALIGEHIRGAEFTNLKDVQNPNCPRGGCWERLLTLVDQVQHGYAIQVDADLVARARLDDAVALYRAGRGFALGNLRSPGVVTFSEMSNWIEYESGFSHTGHIQVDTELGLRNLPDPDNRKYVRASAAFAGLPAHSVSRAQVEEFSQQCHEMLGERWREWGSEQVTSNYLVANSRDPVELAPPRYVNHMPHIPVDEAILVHFFGTYRYRFGNYRRFAESVIGELGGA